MNSLRPDIITSKNLAGGVMNFTTSIGRRFKLEQIIFRASIPISETITITLDSRNGASYDTILRVKSLSAEQNYVFVPEGQNNFYAGDELNITTAGGAVLGTLFCTIKCSEVLQ